MVKSVTQHSYFEKKPNNWMAALKIYTCHPLAWADKKTYTLVYNLIHSANF